VQRTAELIKMLLGLCGGDAAFLSNYFEHLFIFVL